MKKEKQVSKTALKLSFDDIDITNLISQLNPPQPHVPDWFTRELNQLGGKTDNGEPQLRIVWGGSATVFWLGRLRIRYPKFTEKVPIGWEIINPETKERHLVSFKEANELIHLVGRVVYDWIDIGIPMFVIEEWIPPEIACDGWEKRRWEWDRNTATRIDKLGPAPRGGLYRKLITLAELRGHMMYYMEPNEQTLTYIKKMLWLQRQEPMLYSKRERPPEHVVEAMLRKRYAELEAWETKFEDDMVDRMMDRTRRSLIAPTSFASVNNSKEIIIAHK